MNYKEYRHMVIETEKGSLTDYPQILHAIMGMNGEAGECIDILKKHMFQGHKLDVEHLLEELGDVCWYTMLFSIETDLNIDNIFKHIKDVDTPLTLKSKSTDTCAKICTNYILDLNRDCGDITNIYYNTISNKGFAILKIQSIFYNINKVAEIYNRSLEDIFDINNKKIKERYPNGFSTYDSVNRFSNKIELYDGNGKSVDWTYEELDTNKIRIIKVPILGTKYIINIPETIIKEHNNQALKNHDQDFNTLIERGGISWTELYCILTDQSFNIQMDEYKIKKWLMDYYTGTCFQPNKEVK